MIRAAEAILERIETLEIEAEEEGDLEQSELARRALDGDVLALAECVALLGACEAQA